MTWREIIIVVIISWAGAALISLGVYEARQQGDLDDLRSELGDIEDQLSPFGSEDSVLEPGATAGNPARVTVVSVSAEPKAIGGITDGAGSALVRIDNIGADTTVDTLVVPLSATAVDGRACQTLTADATFAGELQPGQYAELTVIWDCADLAELQVYGATFAVPAQPSAE